jgi:magnesium-transporting ATPase (P-type)
MITAVALGLTLSVEPAEPGIMRRPPRDPRQPLLSRALVSRVALVSAIMVVAAFWLFQWERDSGASLAEARTVAVNVFVLVEILYLLNCRSLERSILQVGALSNRWLLVGIATTLGLQLVFTYAPFMHTLFHSAAIDLAAWARVFAAALVGYGVVGVEKWIRRHWIGAP